jgi:hypothetical protein
MNDHTRTILELLIREKIPYTHKANTTNNQIIILECFNSENLTQLGERGFYYDGDELKYCEDKPDEQET